MAYYIVTLHRVDKNQPYEAGKEITRTGLNTETCAACAGVQHTEKYGIETARVFATGLALSLVQTQRFRHVVALVQTERGETVARVGS